MGRRVFAAALILCCQQRRATSQADQTNDASHENELVHAYLTKGVPASERLYNVVTRTLVNASGPPQSGSKPLIVLLTFPNTGTTMTHHLAQCLSPGSMCTAYPNEVVRDRRNGWEYGVQDANGHLLPPHPCAPWCRCSNVPTPKEYPPLASLIKYHGSFGSFSTSRPKIKGETASGFYREMMNSWNVSFRNVDIASFVRVWRNPFDALVARVRFECTKTGKDRHPRFTNCQKIYGKGFDRKALNSALGLADLCVLLQWLHRADLLARWYRQPTTLLSYDDIYKGPEAHQEYIRKLATAMMPPGSLKDAGIARCTLHCGATGSSSTAKCTPRSRQLKQALDGSVLPMYLKPEMYDVRTIRHMAKIITDYLDDTDDFRSEELASCRRLHLVRQFV